MRNLRSLEQTLAENLPWHKARIKFVAAFVIALVTVKTVNLVEIACAFAGQAKQDSQYKKLQRFSAIPGHAACDSAGEPSLP